MKISAYQKEAVLECVNDLQTYYETCGNELDFKNLEILKTVLNCASEPIENIEIFYKNFEKPEKRKR